METRWVRGAAAIAALLCVALPAKAQVLADVAHELVRIDVEPPVTSGKTARMLAVAESAEIPFNGVVFSGRSLSRSISGRIRFSDDGTWTNWLPLRVIRSTVDETVVGGYRGEAIRHGGFELAFETDAGSRIEHVEAGVFDTRLDTEAGAAVEHRQAPKFGATATVDPPELIRRPEWGAEPFIGAPVPLTSSEHRFMTFHHAAGFSATTRAEGLAQVKAIQDLHQEVRGWSDIGYHFVIDRGGRLYQGRPFLDAGADLTSVPRLALGAHVGGANTGNIGICLLGCYHPPEGSFCREEITTPAYNTYVQLFAFLSGAYAVTPSAIRGHRDFSSTACPGDNNYTLLPSIRLDVETLLGDGEGPPTDLTLAEAFPNPFSGEATIRYYLDQDVFVRLAVYDAIGREVAVLADDFQDAGRWYETTLNADGLAAGTYIYRLRTEATGNRVETRARTVVVAK